MQWDYGNVDVEADSENFDSKPDAIMQLLQDSRYAPPNIPDLPDLLRLAPPLLAVPSNPTARPGLPGLPFPPGIFVCPPITGRAATNGQREGVK